MLAEEDATETALCGGSNADGGGADGGVVVLIWCGRVYNTLISIGLHFRRVFQNVICVQQCGAKGQCVPEYSPDEDRTGVWGILKVFANPVGKINGKFCK